MDFIRAICNASGLWCMVKRSIIIVIIFSVFASMVYMWGFSDYATNNILFLPLNETGLDYSESNLNGSFYGNNYGFCFQESADEAPACGGFANGSYAYGGQWSDGNYTTFTNGGDRKVNYTKPYNSSYGTLWQVNYSDFSGIAGHYGFENITIPLDCWNYNSGQINLRLWAGGGVFDKFYVMMCYNGTWKNISQNISTGELNMRIFEEAIYWNKSQPNYTIGKINDAITFNAIDEYIDYGDNLDILDNNLTMCLWYKRNGFDGDWDFMAGKGDSSGTNGRYGWGVSGLSARAMFQFDCGVAVNCYANNNVTEGVWQHLCAIVYRADNISMYIDGNYESSCNLSVHDENLTSYDTNIEFHVAEYGNTGYYYNGTLDEVRVYDRALKEYEVYNIYSTTNYHENVSSNLSSYNNISTNFTLSINWSGFANNVNCSVTVSNDGVSCVNLTSVTTNMTTNCTLNTNYFYSDVEYQLYCTNGSKIYDAPVTLLTFNQPPVALNSSISPSNGVIYNTVLMGYCNATSNWTNTTLAYDYKWYSNDVLNLSGSNSSGFTIETSSHVSTITNLLKRNENWTFTCRAFDGSRYSDWLNSTTLIIGNSPPYSSGSLTKGYEKINFSIDVIGDIDSDNVSNSSIMWYVDNTLFPDFNNLSYINLSNLTIGQDVFVNFSVNDSGNHTWNTTATYTYNDTLAPIMTNCNLSPIKGVSDFTLFVDCQDIGGLSVDTGNGYPKVAIYHNTEGFKVNRTMNYSSGTTYNTTYTFPERSGWYTFRFFCADNNSNLVTNYTSGLQFTIETTSGGGGSGGGTTIINIIEPESKNFSLQTYSGTKSLDFILAKGSKRSRSKELYLRNSDIEAINLRLTCISSDNSTNKKIDICNYVEIANETLTINPSDIDLTETVIKVMTPENASFGDIYNFNLVAYEETEGEILFSKVSVQARVPYYGLVYKWSNFPLTDGRYQYPVLILAIFGGLMFMILSIGIAGRKFAFTGFMVGTLGFVLVFGLILAFV